MLLALLDVNRFNPKLITVYAGTLPIPVHYTNKHFQYIIYRNSSFNFSENKCFYEL